jgi:hypothetical protein
MRRYDNIKAKEQKMKKVMFVAFLAVTLAACAPAQPNMTDVQNTAIAAAYTGVALTQTALPTATPPLPTVTPTATVVVILPTPPPTQPPVPILTPGAIQVERWKEYQTELIKAVLSGYDPALYKYALCEWDILGRSGQEVYVWAWCATRGGGGGKRPAVIHLDTNGAIQKVTVPAINNLTWVSQIQAMFPEDVREKLDLYYFNVCVYCGRPEELRIHLNYRETHPEEPPLVVLLATPTATSTP